MRDETEKLGSAPLWGLLLKLALPAMTGLLVGNLYVIVDRIFVGRYVGETGLAAMTAVMPISMVIWGIAILIGRGGQVLYSIALGARRYQEVQRLFGQNLALSLTASVLLTVPGWIFLDELLFFFGVTSGALAAGRSYLGVSLFGTVFIMLGFLNNFIRAEGYSTLAMCTQLVGAVINVFLDWLLVARFGWGMAGAAWATVIAQAGAAAWVMAFFLSGQSIAKVRFSAIRFYGIGRVARTLYNGLSPFSIGIAGSVVWTVQNRMLIAHGGELALAAFGVILTIGQLLGTPIFGVSMGMQPVVGYNLGAGNYRRMLDAFRYSGWLLAAVELPIWLLIMLFPEPVMRLFAGDHGRLIELGTWSLRRYLLLYPLGSCVTIFVSQYFQSVRKPLYALSIGLSKQMLLELPLAWMLPGFFGYAGVVFAAPAGDCIAAGIAGWLIHRELEKLRCKIR